MRLHLKTAGTSWLQAVRVISRADPSLFRQMLARAVSCFPEAAKLYHVDADPASIPSADGLPDGELEKYLDARDSRQLLHITYGGLLEDPGIRSTFLEALRDNEELHYAAVEQHLEKHVRLLGVPTTAAATATAPAKSAAAKAVRRKN
jgi:hypothetical protein